MYGNVRHVFVKSATNQVVFATPARTDFSVQQTHRDDASNVLWDSQTGGCVSGSAGCSGRSLEDSLLSRDVLPRVVDIWYGLSSGGPPPFVWPFSVRIDNSGRAINAIVTHNQSQCSLPCRINSTYYFPLDTDTVEVDPPSSNPPSCARRRRLRRRCSGTNTDIRFSSASRSCTPAGSTRARSNRRRLPRHGRLHRPRHRGRLRQPKIRVLWNRLPDPRYTMEQRWPEVSRLRAGELAAPHWRLRRAGRARLGHAFWNAWKEDAYSTAIDRRQCATRRSRVVDRHHALVRPRR